MIGKSFLLYFTMVLFLVFVERLDVVDGFIDYYRFGSKYYKFVPEFYVKFFFSLLSFAFGWFIFIERSFVASIEGFKKFHYSYKVLYTSFLLVLINLLSLFFQYGYDVFDRQDYHPDIDYGFFYILYVFSLIVSIVFLAIVASRKSFFSFGCFFSLFLLIIVVFFSYSISTRITGVVLIFVSLIFFMRKQKYNFILYLFFGLLSLLLATYFRSSDKHGMFNYLPALQNVSELSAMIMPVISYGFNYSFYLAIASYYDYIGKGINFYDFVVSFNPLPGSIAGWYGFYQDKFLVKHNVPASAFGSFLATGWIFSSLLFFLLGVVIAKIDNIANRNPKLSIVFLIFGLIFIVYFAQYQMRSAFRYIYYLLFIYLLYHYFSHASFRVFNR